MLKKIILFFLVMILMTGSAFAADARLEVQFIVHHAGTESALTAEALFRENEILLLSGLFPSYAFSVPAEYNGSFEKLSMPDTFGLFSMDEARSSLDMLLQAVHADSSDGIFAGDLFDAADTVAKGEVSLLDFISVLLNPDRSPGMDSLLYKNEVTQNILSASGLPDLSGMIIQYSIFDHGRYLTLNGLDKNRTVFTGSFDFTARNAVKAVFGHTENGKNYYRVHDFSVVSPYEIKLISVLQADPLKQGYRSIKDTLPVVTENWHFRLAENRKEISISGEILPLNEKKSVVITGQITATDSRPFFRAKIAFSGQEESYFTASASMDHLQVNTDHLQIISLNDLSVPSDGGSFLSEINENGLPFMMKLLQALPEEYR